MRSQGVLPWVPKGLLETSTDHTPLLPVYPSVVAEAAPEPVLEYCQITILRIAVTSRRMGEAREQEPKHH